VTTVANIPSTKAVGGSGAGFDVQKLRRDFPILARDVRGRIAAREPERLALRLVHVGIALRIERPLRVLSQVGDERALLIRNDPNAVAAGCDPCLCASGTKRQNGTDVIRIYIDPCECRGLTAHWNPNAPEPECQSRARFTSESDLCNDFVAGGVNALHGVGL